MKRINLLKGMSIALISIMAITGCSSKTETAESAPVEATAPVSEASDEIKFIGNNVVDIDYIKANMENEDFVAVDARGTETMSKDGSLEGAIGVIWQQLATVGDGKSGDANWGVVLDAQRLSEVLSEIGITNEQDIVVFADTKTGWGDDGRILWSLQEAGYNNVKILDGGIDAIKSSGLPMSKTPAAYVPTEVKIDELDLSRSIDTQELTMLVKDGSVKVIDTRDKSEFDGATKYGEKVGGHIPGAVNINFTELLNEDGTLKSNALIDELMVANGFEKNDEIITYCTSGIRSGYMQVILEMNGYTNVRNYDESYYRWCAVNEVEK